jgi:hypothetical protein
MAGKKGMRQREKVMYDPLNLSAVSERFFREEKEAKEKAKLEKKATQAKERASKLKVKKQALNKVRENQRKITAETTKKIKTGQKQLDKQVKRLDKATVTGPLGGEIKVKTLKKISGGAPGLDRGPRSKMFIGKKFSEGGSNMDNGDKPKGKRLTKVPPGKVQVYEKPARPPENKPIFFKKGNPSKVSKKIREQYKKSRKNRKTIPRFMNMGGVMKNRGGTFKGVY